MSQFRSTADLVDSVLRRCGELTNGTSSFETQALDYLNHIHHAIINGGTEFDVEVDEPWVWARRARPIILELQPSLETGTVSLTQGSEAGTFSSAPAYSVEGWFLRISNRSEVFRIASHTASNTAFELDSAYTEDTGATLTYTCFKLDYTVTDSYIVINDENNKLDFIKTGSTELTTTLTAGAYTPADLATHVASALTTTAAGPTITCTYSAVTRKFTVGSNGAGSTILSLQAGTGTNVAQSGWRTLGFDDSNGTGALTYTSTYALSGINRLVEPFRIHQSTREGNIFGLDAVGFQKNYPLNAITEGVPTRFSVIREQPDGTITVRFNSYPTDKTRVEAEHIPVPRDLKDTVGSVPVIPRKFIHTLEYGATYYLMLDKSDKRAQNYASLAAAKLKAMQKQNRKELIRASKNFGQTISRRDMLEVTGKLQYGEPT